MRARVVVGRDVDVIHAGAEIIELVGRVRLRPGFIIEISPGRARTDWTTAQATVESWRIRVLGSNGPIYRGVCRWYPSATVPVDEKTAVVTEIWPK